MSKRLSNNFQFIDVGRGDPDKRTLQSRKTEYVEIYNPFTREYSLGPGLAVNYLMHCRRPEGD